MGRKVKLILAERLFLANRTGRIFTSSIANATVCFLKKKKHSSTQTHVLELIGELGLETYPQHNAGKKVYHRGGPGAGAGARTYTCSIPTLSPLVLLDFMQMLWRVRPRSQTPKVPDPKGPGPQPRRVVGGGGDLDPCFHAQVERLRAAVCVEDPSATPDAVRLDAMTVHSYFEKHVWTEGEHLNAF